jgi:UDP-N-acetylmuramate--alanine ligase
MNIHFIGIGGIGVSALAKYFMETGHQVSGSDLTSSEITNALKKSGAKIFIGKHKAQSLPKKTELVVFSPAVQKNNPELKSAQKQKIKCQTYPEALGELTKKYFTIAVSGTHGKSTTSSMIGLLLVKAGFDPTVIVGTKLKEFGDSNCRVGKSQYLVIEADEFKASFWNYWPQIIVLTTIEKEHMDFFKNLNHIFSVYTKYLSHLPPTGILIANQDDENVYKLGKQFKNTQYYSLRQKESNKLTKLLKIPGEHNVSNALAVLSVARSLKIPDKTTLKALGEYEGSWRRFDQRKVKIGNQDIDVVLDYGHHPTEIKVTLKAAREKFAKRKIWCVFQAHQYQRTYYLWDYFVKMFKNAPVDNLIITDIYDVAGRENEEIKKRVNAQKLIDAINKPYAIYLPKNKIMSYLGKNLEKKDIVIVMGAGDLYKLFC